MSCQAELGHSIVAKEPSKLGRDLGTYTASSPTQGDGFTWRGSARRPAQVPFRDGYLSNVG